MSRCLWAVQFWGDELILEYGDRSIGIDDITMPCLYSNHIHPDARLRDPIEATTDGYVSRRMLEAITTLPNKTQTALLKMLVRLGPLDEITGDGLLSAVLEFSASEGARKASCKALKIGMKAALIFRTDDIDIDSLRSIAEVASAYHPPLLRLLLVSRPMGSMSETLFFLRVWDDVYSHRTRTMWLADVNRIARTVALGPDFDDIVLRFLDNQRNDRGEAMEREIQARLEALQLNGPKPFSETPAP